MNSSVLLARNAQKYPQQEAIVCQDKRITYSELNHFVNKFASSLRENSIQAGDKVILFMPNVLEFAISYFAVQRIGAIVVPISAKLTLKEVTYIVDHANASAIITHELLFNTVNELKKPILKIKSGKPVDDWFSFEFLLQVGSDQEIRCPLRDDDPSTILYTSGTTGKPKGVLFSYRNILTVAQMICVEMEMKPESRVLLMMPLSHSAPLHLFFMGGIVVGATLVLTPTFSPDLLIDTVEKEKTTHFFGAPVAYLLTAKLPQLQTADLSSMKWWIYGGASLSTNEVKLMKQAFRSDDFVCVYGLTEAGPSGSLLSKEEHHLKAGSIGKRAPLHTELRIVDDEGNDVATNEVGEIVLRGEGNMLGYYQNEKATQEAFMGEWLKTGDLAKRDEDGYIWVIDRKDDLIITGGVNIYPKEIEEVLLRYPSIHEAAVIGIPHPEWGTTVKAVFSATEKIEIEILREFLRKNLAASKMPRLFKQVEALPRNASGKIVKHVLRKELSLG